MRGRTSVARCLLEVGQLPQPAHSVLLAIACVQKPSLMAVVATCVPLSPAEWLLFPPSCPGLSAALPAVLARSTTEAALLVSRLPPAERARARCAALSLARAQREAGVELPPALVTTILGAALGSIDANRMRSACWITPVPLRSSSALLPVPLHVHPLPADAATSYCTALCPMFACRTRALFCSYSCAICNDFSPWVGQLRVEKLGGFCLVVMVRAWWFEKQMQGREGRGGGIDNDGWMSAGGTVQRQAAHGRQEEAMGASTQHCWWGAHRVGPPCAAICAVTWSQDRLHCPASAAYDQNLPAQNAQGPCARSTSLIS